MTACRAPHDSPALTVVLGATEAFALTGNPAAVEPRRGKNEASAFGPVLIIWHPSAILRDPATAGASRKFDELIADLRRTANV